MIRELEVACEAARAAGTLLRDRFGTSQQIYLKGPANPVTEMDRQAEQMLRTFLEGAFPTYGFLGEEHGGQCALDQPCWHVDPLDGTTNYAHGYPFFAVSIALEQDGRVIVGVVYNPMLDELFAATLGAGATLNGGRIAVSSTADISESLVASGFPYDVWHNNADNGRQWYALLKRVASMRSDGSAALDLCHVAAGRLDAFWELDLDPWDMAAGALIVREAGGTVTHVSGAPFDIRGRGVAASNGVLHPRLLEVLGTAHEVDEW
jgi:myo-inositol-1(or 4)-monophosphatase